MLIRVVIFRNHILPCPLLHTNLNQVMWVHIIDILYTLDGASLSKIEAKNIPAVSPI